MGIFSALLGNSSLVDQAELKAEYGQLLIEGEEIELGFKLIRDVFMFTTKRIILVDKQGLTGKKVEFKSVPYKNISRFSVETAGSFDLDSELKIWVGSESLPSISKQFTKSVNIFAVQTYLATRVI